MDKNHLIIEMTLSAQANFEHFANAFPIFARNPFFRIAKMQLDEAADLVMGREPDPDRWKVGEKDTAPPGYRDNTDRLDDDPPPRAA